MSSLPLIARCIGRPLEAIRFESFYVDGVMTEVYRAVFFRFDSWLRVISTQGETRVDPIAEPELRPFLARGERQQYPINEVTLAHAVGCVLGQRVVAASEIVSTQDPRRSYGFELDFESPRHESQPLRSQRLGSQRFRSQRLRLLCIDGESMDLSAGRSKLGEEYTRRPLLRVIRGGGEGAAE